MSSEATGDRIESPSWFTSIASGVIDSSSSLHSNLKFRGLVIARGFDFWKLGFQDGRLGIKKSEFKALAKSEAKLVSDDVLRHNEARLFEKDAERTVKEDLYKNRKADYDRTITYYEGLSEYLRLDPRVFSRLLAVGYLLAAILLILADIPLALKLAQEGFDLLPGIDPSLPVYSKPIELESLFYSPLTVLFSYWEVFILSMGIALCTIYIKIFVDQFTERPTFQSTSRAKRPTRIWVFRSVVLVVTLATIFILGMFRHEWKMKLDAEKTTQEFSLSGLANGTATGIDLSPSVPKDPTESRRGTITKITFICITLLFPIIGGVCASMGLNCYHNNRALVQAEKDRVNHERSVSDASGKFQIAVREYQQLKTTLAALKDANTVKEIEGLFETFYGHGYARGSVFDIDPEDERDFYRLICDTRSRVVQRGINKVIQEQGSCT